jgi:hypothetical protein
MYSIHSECYVFASALYKPTAYNMPVFYGREARPLTLSEEHRLNVFENRVLRRTFAPKREKVTGGFIRRYPCSVFNYFQLELTNWTSIHASTRKLLVPHPEQHTVLNCC